jgi:TRAP-type C4-dicarboxylate transport system substrate-binding protein
VQTQNARFQYQCGHDMRADNPVHIRLVEMWAAVNQETDNALSVEVVPWGGLGPSKISLGKLLNGEMAFHPVSGMPLSTVVPIAAMEGLPYAYRTEEEACRVLDGPFGDHLREHVSTAGLVVFPKIWPQGFNQMSSTSRPIRSVEDLDGFRLRTAQVPYKVELFSSLGCDPQQIHYQGISDALASGQAEGQETPYLYTEIDGMAAVQKYMNITNHRFATFWMCANPQRWAALPSAVQEVVTRNLDKYVELYRQDMWAANEAARVRLEKRLEFVYTDTSGFIPRLEKNGFFDRARGRFGAKAWDLLESARGSYPR